MNRDEDEQHARDKIIDTLASGRWRYLFNTDVKPWDGIGDGYDDERDQLKDEARAQLTALETALGIDIVKLAEGPKYLTDKPGNPFVTFDVEEYVAEYEMLFEDEDGREGYYTPSKKEKALIADAIYGALPQLQDAVRAMIEARHTNEPAYPAGPCDCGTQLTRNDEQMLEKALIASSKQATSPPHPMVLLGALASKQEALPPEFQAAIGVDRDKLYEE